MKIIKYWEQPVKKQKRVYNTRKRRLVKQRKKSMYIIILIFLAFIIGYISDSKNEFVIDGGIVEEKSEAVNLVIPKMEGDQDLIVSPSTRVLPVIVEPTMKEWVLGEVKKAGLNPDIAFKIIKCESNWQPEVYGVNKNGSTDFGLWQINSIHRAEISPKERLDYKSSTKWAINKRIKDGNWSAWYSSYHCWGK